ncbi:MAG: GSCFA domain-containing protein [Flavobacterium sp.]|uniref:GSCFA domain-containing protein n=1 Tax=Flavobacterium sp. TaxID=239 RepID=UPI001219286F|nr:GSCFA domain-containing protein [Flavobacterium sp.]RZJ66369.1 MAG: GSCFA domain-containing protein [Flavobacterium sp.]
MQFTTPVSVPKSDFPIDYDSEIISIGSCFAKNMSAKLSHFGFRNIVNPFGILFHPIAIETFLRFAVDGKRFSISDVFCQNERWHCFDAHSDMSGNDAEVLIGNLNSAVSSTREKLETATHFIITLGTAWAYRNITSNELVANCHKVPQKEFSKQLLSVEEIGKSLENCIDLVTSLNPSVRLIFTVSPVRHIKDGVVENQRSKANLISALHSTLEKTRNSHYFPSYEIIMDELRDYRFYASDMLHPNGVAIDFIWEKFRDGWISASAFPMMEEVDSIRKAKAHRPFNPESEQHKKFLSSLESRIANLRKRLPFVDLD